MRAGLGLVESMPAGTCSVSVTPTSLVLLRHSLAQLIGLPENGSHDGNSGASCGVPRASRRGEDHFHTFSIRSARPCHAAVLTSDESAARASASRAAFGGNGTLAGPQPAEPRSGGDRT